MVPPGLRVLSNRFEDVASQGMEVVGSPVGSMDFQQRFVDSTLEGYLTSRLDLLKLHPQCAVRLLLQCVSACPTFVSQVVHPDVTKGPLTTSTTVFGPYSWGSWEILVGISWTVVTRA